MFWRNGGKEGRNRGRLTSVGRREGGRSYGMERKEGGSEWGKEEQSHEANREGRTEKGKKILAFLCQGDECMAFSREKEGRREGKGRKEGEQPKEGQRRTEFFFLIIVIGWFLALALVYTSHILCNLYTFLFYSLLCYSFVEDPSVNHFWWSWYPQ